MSNKSKDADPKQPNSSFIQFDDAKQQGAASAASAPRRKALTGVLTAACVALIVISLGFVHPSESGAWSIDWIVQTVTSSRRTPRGLTRPSLRVKLAPRIPNLRMVRTTSLRVRINLTLRRSPSLRTRNQTRARIAKSPKTRMARSLERRTAIKRPTAISRLLRTRLLLAGPALRLAPPPHPAGHLLPPITATPLLATRAARSSLATLR